MPNYIIQARKLIADLARKDGEFIFAREVLAGVWDDRDDVQAAAKDFESTNANAVTAAWRARNTARLQKTE